MTAPQKATSPTTDLGLGRWPWIEAANCAGSGSTASSTPAVPLVDFDRRGHADDRLFDTDDNGVADRVLCGGENGVTGYVDTDGDGRWNVRLTDTDGDGLADGASSL